MRQMTADEKRCEKQDELKIVEDYIDVFDTLNYSMQRQIVFLLVTDYRHIIRSYYKSLIKNNLALSKMIEEVISHTVSYFSISKFTDWNEPVYQKKYYLLKEQAAEEEKKIFEKRMNEFRASLISLNQLRVSLSETYETKKDAFFSEYLLELSRPENHWILAWFGLDFEDRNRTKKR